MQRGLHLSQEGKTIVKCSGACPSNNLTALQMNLKSKRLVSSKDGAMWTQCVMEAKISQKMLSTLRSVKVHVQLDWENAHLAASRPYLKLTRKVKPILIGFDSQIRLLNGLNLDNIIDSARL